MLGRQFMWLAVRGGGQERRFPRPRHAAVTDSPSRVSLLRDSEKTEKGMDAMAHSSPANSFLPSSPPSFYIDRNWFIEFPTRSFILPKPLYWLFDSVEMEPVIPVFVESPAPAPTYRGVLLGSPTTYLSQFQF
ncbi:hypothetical protein GW17_00020372 [Ensete ventricosum]|nr:hypothetical protein GW17_00020372 [Ensete ventricosum]